MNEEIWTNHLDKHGYRSKADQMVSRYKFYFERSKTKRQFTTNQYGWNSELDWIEFKVRNKKDYRRVWKLYTNQLHYTQENLVLIFKANNYWRWEMSVELFLKKVFLSIWWDYRWILYYELLPHIWTIDSEKYKVHI